MRTFGSEARSGLASPANAWSRLLRAPWSHQTSRLGVLVRQRVEHGEHRRRADAGADQQHGRLGPVEDERAARRGDVELVAHGEPRVKPAAGDALVLPLDGEAVVAGAGRSRERVVPQDRSRAVVRLDAEREVLAGTRGGSATPAGSSSRTETTVSLSRSIPATVSRRNPGHAGGGP